MSRKKKYIILGSILILFLAGIILIIKKMNAVQPQSVVLPAISQEIANGMVKKNECYIVRVANPDEFGTGGWYYMEGKEKKKITLLGKHPTEELSQIFLQSDQNSFLVKGYMDEKLQEDGKDPVFCIESWYLIAPIKRNYGNKEYRENQRFFYPKSYLDTYDVEQGDYLPINTYDVVWDSFADYYLEQDGYYKIRSRWNGTELEWFLVFNSTYSGKKSGVRYFEGGYAERRIYIKGNSPEYSLSATILNNGYYDEDCRDYFIVKGNLEISEEGAEMLEIYKWWIKTPFVYKDASGIKLESGYGFTREDIEAGIYKSYR